MSRTTFGGPTSSTPITVTLLPQGSNSYVRAMGVARNTGAVDLNYTLTYLDIFGRNVPRSGTMLPGAVLPFNSILVASGAPVTQLTVSVSSDVAGTVSGEFENF